MRRTTHLVRESRCRDTVTEHLSDFASALGRSGGGCAERDIFPIHFNAIPLRSGVIRQASTRQPTPILHERTSLVFRGPPKSAGVSSRVVESMTDFDTGGGGLHHAYGKGQIRTLLLISPWMLRFLIDGGCGGANKSTDARIVLHIHDATPVAFRAPIHEYSPSE